MEKFLATILGNTTGGEMLGYMVLGLIGASIYLIIKVSNRKKTDNGKPEVWDWWFFFQDNILRVVLTLLFVYVWASNGDAMNKFFEEEVPWIGSFGKGIYIAIGFLTDIIVVFIDKGRRKIQDWIKNKVDISVDETKS